MRRDNVSDFFAQTYAQRRLKFLFGVARIGGITANCEHPVAFGPRYGSLPIDVAYFGRKDARNVDLLLSGMHGGAAYAGSTVPIALMKTGMLVALKPDVRVWCTASIPTQVPYLPNRLRSAARGRAVTNRNAAGSVNSINALERRS
jgi:Protein of unknown function (DUF2817)